MSTEPRPNISSAMEYCFNAEEWKRLSAAERASRCRLLAEQAKLLAAQAATPGDRQPYENIAREWLTLAIAIEREANIPSQAAKDDRSRPTGSR